MHKHVCIILHIQKIKKLRAEGLNFKTEMITLFLTNRETQSD